MVSLTEPDEARSADVPTISAFLKAAADSLTANLDAHMRNSFQPHDEKHLRKFSIAETAELIGVTDAYIRKLHTQDAIDDVEADGRGRRWYSADQIHKIRNYLAHGNRSENNPFQVGRGEQDGLQVISVANFKGGSAKSTTTAYLSHRLALRGYRVLCLDLDPQASLTTIFGYRPELEFADRGTVYDVLTYDDPVPISEIIKKSYFPNLDLAPAGIMLSEFETETAYALAGDAANGAPVGEPFYSRLKAALAEVDDQYDIVLIDCPPQIGFLTLTALTGSTGVLTTIVPGMFDVASMAQFLHLSASLLQSIEAQSVSLDWRFLKYAITRYEPNDGSQQQIAALLRLTLGDSVLQNEFLKSAAVEDAASTQETIYELDPRSVNKRTLQRALDSFNSVAFEIEALIQTAWGRDSTAMLRGRK